MDRTIRIKTRTKVIAGLIVLAAIATAVIGPFTFYGSVVPYLAWVLPKPDGVPSDANAEYHWKGFGLSWQWQRELPSGCATWMAANDRYIGVRLKRSKCDQSDKSFGFSNFMRDDDIDFNPADSGSYHCSIHTTDVTPKAIAQSARLLSEAKQAAKGEAEYRLIELSQAFLNQPKPAEGEHPCGEEYAARLKAAGKWP